MYGSGISREGDILDLAAEINVINKSGSWYSYNGTKLAQGRESTKAYLLEHPDFMLEVEKKVREHYHLQTDGTRYKEKENGQDENNESEGGTQEIWSGNNFCVKG